MQVQDEEVEDEMGGWVGGACPQQIAPLAPWTDTLISEVSVDSEAGTRR